MLKQDLMNRIIEEAMEKDEEVRFYFLTHRLSEQAIVEAIELNATSLLYQFEQFCRNSLELPQKFSTWLRRELSCEYDEA